MSEYLEGGHLTAAGAERIMVEVSLGLPLAESWLPDVAEVREFRDKVAPEIAAIAAKGHVLDFDGGEFPA